MVPGLLLLLFLGGGLRGLRGAASVNRGGYPSFSDEVPFKITWPGPEFTLVGPPCAATLFTVCASLYAFACRLQPSSGVFYSEEDFVIMTTAEREKYKCLLPSLTAGDEVSGRTGTSG